MLNIQSVREVIKIGDTLADMLEGRNAGCRGVVGVLSGPRPVTNWGRYWHTHVIPSVADLPGLIEKEFFNGEEGFGAELSRQWHPSMGVSQH